MKSTLLCWLLSSTAGGAYSIFNRCEFQLATYVVLEREYAHAQVFLTSGLIPAQLYTLPASILPWQMDACKTYTIWVFPEVILPQRAPHGKAQLKTRAGHLFALRFDCMAITFPHAVILQNYPKFLPRTLSCSGVTENDIRTIITGHFYLRGWKHVASCPAPKCYSSIDCSLRALPMMFPPFASSSFLLFFFFLLIPPENAIVRLALHCTQMAPSGLMYMLVKALPAFSHYSTVPPSGGFAGVPSLKAKWVEGNQCLSPIDCWVQLVVMESVLTHQVAAWWWICQDVHMR